MPATARRPGPRARDALHIDASPAQGPWKPQRHALVDLWECPADSLSDEEFIREAMLEAADRAGATIIGQLDRASDAAGSRVAEHPVPTKKKTPQAYERGRRSRERVGTSAQPATGDR
jgi:hypothetical protein